MTPIHAHDAIMGKLMADLVGIDNKQVIMSGIGECLFKHLPMANVYILCQDIKNMHLQLLKAGQSTLYSEHDLSNPFFSFFQEPKAPTLIQQLPPEIHRSLQDFPFTPTDLVYPVHSFGKLQGIFILQAHTPLSADDHMLLFSLTHHMLILFDQLSYKEHISQLQHALDDATKAASIFWLINDYMHDLKTPWGLLQMSTDPKSGCITPDDFRQRIAKYSDRAYKTLATINRILARDRERVSITIDLCKAVQDILEAHSDMKIVQFNKPTIRPFIMGDPSDIDILLINLIKNAKEAIRTDVLQKHDIIVTISYDSKQQKVRLSVKDTGCGMSEETVKAILEGHAHTTKNFGSGIGTRAILRIVKDHNATLELLSQEGCGSEFIILFSPA